MSATIYSVYFTNIDQATIRAQNDVVRGFLPSDMTFVQYLHRPQKSEAHPHATALESCVKACPTDTIIFLDIDCIPVCREALGMLVAQVNNGKGQGLAGAVQRANHIYNNRHVYVGPFCMAFNKSYYQQVGSPSFAETVRGDVGEELTYIWTEAAGVLPLLRAHKYSENIHFIIPTNVLQPLWELDFGVKFGFGTTYGIRGSKDLFYHNFNAREPHMQKLFVERCNRVLDANHLQRKAS